MRRLASGVSVVTSVWQGVRHGMTVTSFVSVALDPPLVTITLAKGTRTEQMVRASGRFGVSILASDQQHIAEIFSGKVPEQANRFADIAVFELEEGLPLISGGLGAMACEVREAVELDRSALLIGLVKRTWSREDGMPLLYMDRAYRFMKSG